MKFNIGDIVTVQINDDAKQMVEGTIVGFSTFKNYTEYLITPLCYDNIAFGFLLKWNAFDANSDKKGVRETKLALGEMVVSYYNFGCVWWAENKLQQSRSNDNDDRGGLKFL